MTELQHYIWALIKTDRMFVTVRPASLHCCPFSFHSAVHHPYIPTYSLQWYEDLLSTNTDPSLGRISDTPPSWGESMWSKNIHFPCMRGGGRGGDPSFLNTTQRISVENSAQIFTTWLRTAAKDYNCCHSLYPRHFQALMKENRCPGGETISATVFWFKTHNKCLGKTLEKECVWRAGRTAENQTLPSTSWIHTHTHTERLDTNHKPNQSITNQAAAKESRNPGPASTWHWDEAHQRTGTSCCTAVTHSQEEANGCLGILQILSSLFDISFCRIPREHESFTARGLSRNELQEASHEEPQVFPP